MVEKLAIKVGQIHKRLKIPQFFFELDRSVSDEAGFLQRVDNPKIPGLGMTINSEWVALMKDEARGAFTKGVPFTPKVAYIDGMPLLMVSDTLRKWDDLVRFCFAIPVQRFFTMGAKTVVLAFDDYKYVPQAKAITQASRAKAKGQVEFGENEQLESVIPFDYGVKICNRAYKMRVIHLIIECITAHIRLDVTKGQRLIIDYTDCPILYEPADISHSAAATSAVPPTHHHHHHRSGSTASSSSSSNLPPPPRKKSRKHDDAEATAASVAPVDEETKKPCPGNARITHRFLTAIPPNGECDVKFTRWGKMLGDMVAYSVDGDFIPISLMELERQEREKDPKPFRIALYRIETAARAETTARKKPVEEECHPVKGMPNKHKQQALLTQSNSGKVIITEGFVTGLVTGEAADAALAAERKHHELPVPLVKKKRSMEYVSINHLYLVLREAMRQCSPSDVMSKDHEMHYMRILAVLIGLTGTDFSRLVQLLIITVALSIIQFSFVLFHALLWIK